MEAYAGAFYGRTDCLFLYQAGDNISLVMLRLQSETPFEMWQIGHRAWC